jgi:hypothetical protein
MTDSNTIINKMLREEEHQEQNAEFESFEFKKEMEESEDASFSGDGSVTDSTKTPTNLQSRGEEVAMIAQPENNAVSRLRLVVVFVLLAATIGVSIMVYYYVHNDEEKSFEDQFHDDSLKTLDSIGTSLDQTLSALDGFAVTLVIYAKAQNLTWPFVTVPDYGECTIIWLVLSASYIFIDGALSFYLFYIQPCELPSSGVSPKLSMPDNIRWYSRNSVSSGKSIRSKMTIGWTKELKHNQMMRATKEKSLQSTNRSGLFTTIMVSLRITLRSSFQRGKVRPWSPFTILTIGMVANIPSCCIRFRP